MRVPWAKVDPVDVVLALAVTLALQVEILVPELLGADPIGSGRGWLAVSSLLVTVPLAFRRTAPWTVATVALGTVVAQSRLGTLSDGLGNLLAMLVVAYSLGRYAPRPAGYSGAALVAGASFGIGEDLADNLFVMVVLGSAWAAGVVVGRRTDDLGSLELRRLAATRAGAEEERLRIARELHDVVAHRVSMIVVQSQLADTLLERDPAGARVAIGAVEDAGREALVELRSILGLLHEEPPASRSPRHTDLGRLGDLVDEVRAGGLPAGFTIDGEPRPVPPAVSLASFRIVQESLTNVVKHAGAAPTRVHLAYLLGAVEVCVENNGPTVPEPQPGHGLAGMRERAAFVGGSLEAGPVPEGGFRVRAVLPTPELTA
ncbi:sensor histidine kinase [Nocardioides bizhenqiangii]|uniref:histidine kinase n=1 Tax=Nocardioides bizhenqiangii TaxID=3095076 RepID=A0ABZ0ZJ39_9ACTN|nr:MULTISPECIES: histidine kinase [unclassified Nocardioides]MDZ5620175.1 histidine kinase [Nocardioides sp. HM23]WQQ24553.1 histidine kinase [Nocardioides sp. HM61]